LNEWTAELFLPSPRPHISGDAKNLEHLGVTR
jgi:hypothetical protein